MTPLDNADNKVLYGKRDDLAKICRKDTGRREQIDIDAQRWRVNELKASADAEHLDSAGRDWPEF